MGSFLTAYVVLWLGVAGYMVWLAAEQRRLQRTLDASQWGLAESEDHQPPASKAA